MIMMINISRNTQFILYGTVAQLSAKSCFQWIIFTSIVICIEKFLEPLQEFEIVLESTFDQFIHWNYLQQMEWVKITVK